MSRKSKHASSGHLPLTNYERKKIGSNYGTSTARLSGVSQQKFGHCALSLHPAKEQPVATPSGFIYETNAMLEYLLHRTQELKKEQQRYDQWRRDWEAKYDNDKETKRKLDLKKFEDEQKVVTKKQKVKADNPLAVSYWLADFQPEKSDEPPETMEPPPKRPCSPMTQAPLRRKDLVPLELKRNSDDQVICAISEKTIVNQKAIALVTKGSERPAQVVLEQVFKDLGEEKICPATGRKIAKVLKLQSGASSFAASGSVEAKTYRPGMT